MPVNRATLRALSAFARQLCPEPCPRCGREHAGGFCSDCQRDFARVPAPCARCAMPWPCAPCRADRDDWRIDRMNAPFVYAEPLSTFLKALKYRGRRELGRALGELLATEIRSENLNVDRILGVPLHPRRLRARTFNQAHEIARALSRRYRWPLAAGVRRLIDTPPQTERDRSERQRFASSAFHVQANLAGARIAVVDDVVTTGATINALAAALKAAGAAEVQAWAVARSTGDAGARAAPPVGRQPARKM